jgi:hypothetical protein
MTRKLAIALAATCGVFFGGVVSDIAAVKKFPHGRYLLEMTLDGSPGSSYICERNGAVFGENLSSFDRRRNVQKDCLLYTSGEPRSDGSLDVYLDSQTWLGWLKSASSPIHGKAPAIPS